MTSSIVVGLDIGTTSSKAVAWSASRHGRPFAEQSTPWQTDACGRTEIHHWRQQRHRNGRGGAIPTAPARAHT